MEITHFLVALWQLSITMAPYILFGLLFAEVLHELVPDSIVTIGVVKKMLCTKSLVIYLGSILFGLGLDYIFDASNIDPTSLILLHKEAGTLSILSSIVLWGCILWFMIKPYLKKKDDCDRGSCCT